MFNKELNGGKRKNVIRKKSYNFALLIIKLHQSLDKQNEYILSKQLVRSGTSIGANVEEAIGAYSKKEFLSKIFIAYKEARETHYWLRLLKDAEYISEDSAASLLNHNEGLLKIMGAIIRTTQSSINN